MSRDLGTCDLDRLYPHPNRDNRPAFIRRSHFIPWRPDQYCPPAIEITDGGLPIRMGMRSRGRSPGDEIFSYKLEPTCFFFYSDVASEPKPVKNKATPARKEIVCDVKLPQKIDVKLPQNHAVRHRMNDIPIMTYGLKCFEREVSHWVDFFSDLMNRCRKSQYILPVLGAGAAVGALAFPRSRSRSRNCPKILAPHPSLESIREA